MCNCLESYTAWSWTSTRSVIRSIRFTVKPYGPSFVLYKKYFFNNPENTTFKTLLCLFRFSFLPPALRQKLERANFSPPAAHPG